MKSHLGSQHTEAQILKKPRALVKYHWYWRVGLVRLGLLEFQHLLDVGGDMPTGNRIRDAARQENYLLLPLCTWKKTTLPCYLFDVYSVRKQTPRQGSPLVAQQPGELPSQNTASICTETNARNLSFMDTKIPACIWST